MNLDTLIKNLIRSQGSIPLETYMTLCLRHPEYGYYVAQNPLGQKGDFTTSPEISQLFGEMVALRCIQMWEHLGSPSSLHICEIGPGRGALMVDLIRTFQKFPTFYQALHVHLVDIHPGLRALQEQALEPLRTSRSPPFSWWTCWPTHALKSPTLIIANEFWDALPLRQTLWEHSQWWDHHVIFDDTINQYALIKVPAPHAFASHPVPPHGWIIETMPEADSWFQSIAQTLNLHGGGGLWIDYGTDQPTGLSTWRGFSAHQPCSPLSNPGQVDQTSDVNFALMRDWATGHGYTFTLESQHHFLRRMGIELRLERLMTKTQDHQIAVDLLTGYLRIMEDLGRLFKVFAFYT